jgi:uncharacterized delta-60 repeat protein
MTINYTISVNILPAKQVKSFAYTISTTITPAAPTEQQAELNYPFTFNVRSIELSISEITKQVATEFFQNLLTLYIDEDRELKELLNYGEDRQSVILAKRVGPIDATGTPTIQLKLLQPVPDDIGIDDRTFISREIANSVIDKFRVRFAPEIDATPFLRPKNTGIRVNNQIGKTLRNVTLQFLSLDSGSVGARDVSSNVSFEDQIFRRWYSYDFNSSELNLDFTNYENFIFYGSAALRLEAFVQKLYTLDKLNVSSKQFEGSIFTGQLASAGASYILEQSAKFSKEKEDIIRSFDRYEQYLYFTPSGSNSAYSASFDYVDGGTEYNSIGYWPKRPDNTLYHPTESIAENWYADQLDIARRYDEVNPNSLINTIPSYLRDDDDNAAYFTFVLMIGHFFDLIKPYIDQFPEIYNRGLNPNENLSKDLVYNIAEAVGFPLPTLNSLYDISDTILGTESVLPRRDYAVEAHKRILHNLPMFIKNKGTKTSIRSALRTLGIAPQLLDVWETGATRTTVAERNTSRGTYVFEEYTNGLDFSLTSNGSITIPVSSSVRTPYPRSLELSVKFSSPSSCTILEGDDKWALNVVTHPTNDDLGRFEIVNELGDILMSSSYHEIFDGNTLHLSLKNNLTAAVSSFAVYEVDIYGISFESFYLDTSTSFTSRWATTDDIIIGGTEPLSINNFDGILDEFRLLGTNLTTSNSELLAQDPSSIAGNNYTQAAELLYIQLSFNRIDNSLLPVSIINESPYKDKADSPSIETLTAQNITSEAFVRYSRNIRQALPVVGNSSYVSQKVYIAPVQEFTPEFVSGEGVKQLSRTRSVVTNRKLISRGGRNKVIISTSPSRIINDNIIRTMGAVNINSALGIPSQYRTLDNTLEKLRNYYNQYYYVSVNYNQYIRVLSEIHSVLNDYIEYFIPSKASLLRGIVIEPNILEQTKFPTLKNIRFYGSKSRKTKNAVASLTGSNADYGATFNVAQTIDTRPEIELPASYDTTQALIPREMSEPQVISQTYDIQHLDWYEHMIISNSYVTSSEVFQETPFLPKPKVSIQAAPLELDVMSATYDLQHLDWYEHMIISNSYVTSSDVFQETPFLPKPKAAVQVENFDEVLSAFLPQYSASTIDLGYSQLNKFTFNDENRGTWGAEPFHRIYPRRLFDEELNLPRLGGITSLAPAGLYDIPPISDFNELGTYTYFNRPSGIYDFKTTKFTPVYPQPLNATWDFDNQAFMGATTWSYGAKFNINDVVYQNTTKDSAQIITPTPTEVLQEYLGNNFVGLFNDYVTAAAIDGDDSIYVAGRFTSYSGSAAGGIIKLLPGGIVDTTFNVGEGINPNGYIYTIKLDSFNNLYVGGNDITSYSGSAVTNLFKINSDGTLDTSFNTGIIEYDDGSFSYSSDIIALDFDSNDKLYVGGYFTTYSGSSASGIVKINPNGTIDNSFNIGTGFIDSGLPGGVYAITIDENEKVYVGGYFQEYSGSLDNNYIIRLNADGTKDTAFDNSTGFNSTVYAFQLDSNGKLYVGGQFTTYKGATNNRIIRLNADGTKDTAFDNSTGFNSTVRVLQLDSNGKLYVGGNFSTYKGATNLFVTRLNPDGTKDTGFDNSTEVDNIISALQIDSNGKLYIGGFFTKYKDNISPFFVQVNDNGTIGNSTYVVNVNNTGFDDLVWTTAYASDGKLYVGGRFTTYNGVSCNRLVRLNQNGTIDDTFDVGIGFNSDVISIALTSDDKIYVGGAFSTYKGATNNRIIRLNSDGTKDTAFNNSTGFNSQVDSIALTSDGKVYVGGNFTTYKGATNVRIIRLNDDGTKDTGFDNTTGFNSTVYAFQLDSNGKLYVGGQFTTYKGATNNRIIRLNADGTKDTAFDNSTGFNSTVRVLQLDSNGKLYVGGNFSTYKGATNLFVTRLNPDGTKDTGFDNSTGFSGGYSIALAPDGKIYVGGNSIFVRLNDDGTEDTSFNFVKTNATVGSIALTLDNKIFIAGSFISCNETYNGRIALLDPTGELATEYTETILVPVVTYSPSLDLISLARTGNGKYYVFTTKPAYSDPGDGTAWYSGSVPSYIPPSLDGTNWTRLRFRPEVTPDLRRIVFDTFTVPDPVLNNFKTTTLNIDTPVDITRRYIDLLRIPNIAPNSFIQGELLLQNVAALFALQSNNSGIRIRLYRTSNDMAADLPRNILTLPTGSHGVLADIQITEENNVQLINPIITLVADSIPPGGKIFYTINNLTATAKISTTILGYYFAIQIEPRVPLGYLRKHYRFVRDNSTATKRRKYLGCKFKIVRYTTDGQPVYDTIDGRPPVEIFLSEGTDVVVNRNNSNNEITTGGGGTLRIT